MTEINPTLRPGVVVDPPVDGYAIIHDGNRRKYFRMGAREAAFLSSLDGATSPEQLRAEQRLGFTAEQTGRLVDWLEQNQLLECSVALGKDADQAGWRRALNYVIYPDKFRFTLFNPDSFLDRHRRAVDALFGRSAVALYLLVFLSPFFMLVVFSDQFFAAFSNYDPVMPIWQWPLLYVSMLIITFFHEMSHAAACKHFGGKVEVVGVMLLYLNPVAYCDISASWRFASATDKVIVSGAGIFFQMLVASISFSLFGFVHETFFAYLAIANAFFAIFNLIPFVKLDGYWMLVHLSGQPNLRRKSLEAIDSAVRRFLGSGVSRGSSDRLLLAFGMAHLVFVPLFWLAGVAAIYRVAKILAPSLALYACAPFFALLLYRLSKSASAYVNSLRT